MNLKKACIIVATLVACIAADAQSITSVTNVDQNGNITITRTINNTPTNAPATNGFTSLLTAAGKDLLADFELARPFTTNGNATVRVGGGANLTTHKAVVALMVTVPMSDMLGIGGIVAYKNGQLYEGGANLTLGVTNSWPVIGQVQQFVADGIIYNFRTREPANYAATGIDKTLISSSRIEFGLGGVIANTSDEQGVDLLVGAHLTYFWSPRKVSQ